MMDIIHSRITFPRLEITRILDYNKEHFKNHADRFLIYIIVLKTLRFLLP